MSTVSYLNISHNEISSLEDFRYSQFFLSSKDKPRLTLDVRDNHIQTIPDWLLTMEFTTELFISGNPIQCSCIKAHQYRAFLEVRNGVDISPSVWGHHVGGSQCRGVSGDRGLPCCDQLLPPPPPHHCGGDSRPGGSWYHWTIFSSLDQISLLLGVMFYRDWKVYKTTRKLPLLASYVPTWVPAFPFNLMGSEKKKSKTSRKISNISSFSFLSNSSQNSGRSSSG